MTLSIGSVGDRNKLKARHEPHFIKLARGNYLGFQKLTPASVGNWIARSREPFTGKQTKRSLGDFADLLPSARFDAAKRAAEVWFEHLGQGGSTAAVTVRAACEGYVEDLRDKGEIANAADAEGRFKRHVYGAPVAAVELRHLREDHLRAWRRKLCGTVVVVNPHAAVEDRITRPRSASAINRDMVPLRAALRLAKARKLVTTDAAWSESLEPVKGADRRRDGYLDRTQRATLIAHAPADLAALVRGLSLVPLRPGALAALTVGDFDRRLNTLKINTDKAGAGRTVTLPPATAAFFAEQARDKLPGAPLFARADGSAWNKDAWKKPFKEAASTANLPPATVAYSLRHSTITDLVSAGLDLPTVATLAGTSASMIQKHYAHLQQQRAADALALLAL